MDDRLLKLCFICGQEGKISTEANPHVIRQRNCSCGHYLITVFDKDTCFSRDHDGIENRNEKLSAIIREQTIRKLPPFFLQWPNPSEAYPPVHNCTPVEVPDLIRSSWPKDVPEMMDRTLCNLARISSEAGKKLPIDLSEAGVIFSRSYDERQFILNSLEEYHYITKRQGDHSGLFACFLTPKGWCHYSELTRESRNPENPAFVAMWFGDDTHRQELNELFVKSIKAAIRDAGYDGNRVDIEEHNDFIMDKIIADIRQAPFVVADFTGNRGGVYFEAGFARGQNIPVIHTCKDTHFDDAHFDVKQINTLIWAQPSELYEGLLQRIRGTVGEGPGVRGGTRGEKSRPVESPSA